MAYTDWGTATLHYADEDLTTPTPYDTAVVADVALFDGYGTKVLGIIAPQHKIALIGDAFEDINGVMSDIAIVARNTYDIELYPFEYKDSAIEWKLGVDYPEIMDLLRTKRHKWISFNVSTHSYHTAGHCIPVKLKSAPPETIERETGTRFITIPLLHKYLRA